MCVAHHDASQVGSAAIEAENHLGPAREEVRALLTEAAAARGATGPSIDLEIQQADPPPLKLSGLDLRFLGSLKITAEAE